MKRPMKRLLTLSGLCIAVLFGHSACSEDNAPGYPDVNAEAPEIQVESSIQTEPGRDIQLKGKILDDDGIASISLSCPGLYIKKTIDLLSIKKELLYEYDLDYKIRIDMNEIGDLYTLDIEATDVGGRKSSASVSITLDGDYAYPEFKSVPSGSVAVIVVKGQTSTSVSLPLRVTDNRSIDRIEISIPDIEYNETINAGGVQDFSTTMTIDLKDISLPEKGALTYEVQITVYDKSGKSAEKKFDLKISELQDFEEMYLADVTDERDLTSDIMGVPMLCKHTGEYTYVAEYYNRTANTPICFIPQTTSFTPTMFGVDPADKEKLTINSPERIVLPEAGVYYRIEINTKEGTYSLETFSVNEAIDPVPHEFGSKNLDTWGSGEDLREFYFGLLFSNPPSVENYRFVQDENNPHLYRLKEPITYSFGDRVNFYIHNWHPSEWWDYCSWKVDKKYKSNDPSIFGYTGDKVNQVWINAGNSKLSDGDWVDVKCPVGGTYTFEFDAYTGWGKFIPVN